MSFSPLIFAPGDVDRGEIASDTLTDVKIVDRLHRDTVAKGGEQPVLGERVTRRARLAPKQQT
jgi:hypothetical protein